MLYNVEDSLNLTQVNYRMPNKLKPKIYGDPSQNYIVENKRNMTSECLL